MTEADGATEDFIRGELARLFPGEAILGEEGGGEVPASGPLWIIDPIDGTSNFTRGGDRWCVSIGLALDGRAILGAIARHAPHRDAAARFLEYLASDEAQRMLADGNNEWPAVPTVSVKNPALESLGKFRQDTLPVAQIGRAQVNAARIIDRAGWR